MPRQSATFSGLALMAALSYIMLSSRWEELPPAFVPATPQVGMQRSFLRGTSGLPAPEASAPLAASAVMLSAAVVSFGFVRSRSPRQPSLVQLRAEASSAKMEEEEDDEEDSDDEEDEEDDEDTDESKIDKFGEVLEDRGYFEEDDEADFDDFEESSEDAHRKVEAKMTMVKGSPMKFEKVMYQIRGRSYRDALMMLEFLPWKASKPTLKCLKQAGQMAETQKNMDKSRLFVYSAQAYEAMRMRRMRCGSKGQPIMFYRKKTNIYIMLKEWTDREIDEKKEWLGRPVNPRDEKYGEWKNQVNAKWSNA